MTISTLRLAGLVGLLCAISQLSAQSAVPAAKPVSARPKLLLAIALDQFRYDYLTRFRSEYNAGLFRLLTQGAVFTNAHYDHSPTVTAIGHATMLSGASPIVSGIVSNEWFDRDTAKVVTSVEDPKLEMVGGTEKASSPHRLLVSTVADEIKLAGRGESKTIGISMKDRSAILMPGRMADAAYWFVEEEGNWVSSTWYMKGLPKWVADLNASRPADRWLGKPWIPLSGGKALLTLPSRPDTMYYSNVEKSPYGNELLEEFAELAIENEKLGQHAATDVLTISFSANDKVGHAYGPDSAEVHDITIRTDRLLGKLFAFIDKKIGMKNVLVALTADHGVAPKPEVNAARKMPGGRLKAQTYADAVENALVTRFGGKDWIAGKKNEQLFLKPELLSGKDGAAVRATAADALRKMPHVARVYTKEQFLRGETGQDMVGRRAANGYHAGRGPDIVIVFDPYYIFGTDSTSHGTPYSYDTHVPIILMGAGVKPGKYHQPATVNDLAPTLSTILEVEVPAGAMGRVLHEALNP